MTQGGRGSGKTNATLTKDYVDRLERVRLMKQTRKGG